MSRDKISILIVDDEPEARDLLSMLLARIAGVEVTGTADRVDQAFEMIVNQRPDLVLLDIQMPEKNGFELVRMVHEKHLEAGFVFVTAYDEYAIEAIKVSAFDYLLKPVDMDALLDSIERFRAQRRQSNLQQLGLMLEELNHKSKIKVNTRSGFILIDPQEVIHCVASGNYTEVYLVNNRVEIVTSNLGTFTDQLPGRHFFRISRSGIINLNYLSRVDNKAGTCRMSADTDIELKVARNRRSELDEVCRTD